uniref:SAM domain-containing protein n=1 Tax=Gouania willdenowi TaxID=441366 RepID=A0A8C5G7D1_GOUWI
MDLFILALNPVISLHTSNECLCLCVCSSNIAANQDHIDLRLSTWLLLGSRVEVSLQSSFQPGMKLEVANKGSPDTYWVATIITTCGQLLLLRFSGYGDDRKADFWCDVMSAELHPVGWCAQNNRTLIPPEAIKEKYNNWTEFLVQELTGARTAPANLLEGPLRGKNTVDLIVEGSFLDLQDSSDPFLYWPVRVIQNVGGRLRLCYAGLSEDQRAQDSWMFYLDVRLHPLGWAKENNFSLEPPTGERHIQEGPHTGLKSLTFLCQDHMEVPRHSFKAGMKLEMVSPWEQLKICPVSVTKIYNEFYFQVTLDDLSTDAKARSVLCHAHSPGILPVQWCLKNSVGVEKPEGYEGQDFDWADYLKQSSTEAAPDACFPDTWQNRGFAKDTWLEAVNPRRPAEVCVARITQVRGRLLWLQLEGVPKPLSECIVDVDSMDIFPVGWCEANSYPLTSPVKAVCQKQKKIAVIFVNHRCFSGPYLNKGRIAELPQAVGPGKCTLVLKELLNMLINAAYKPGRVLKELQDLEDQSWDCQDETLKAKYKGKTYRSTIRIIRLADQIPDFCRKVCVKLQCCPNLFSPVLIHDKCPENCSVQTKTKYTYYYGKKRKLCKPRGAEEAADGEMTKPTRRRKKRKAIFVQKKRRSSTVDYTPAGSPQVGLFITFCLRFLKAELKPSLLMTDYNTYKLQRLKTTSLIVEENEDLLVLDRNPLEWSVEDVVNFINATDCSSLANIFQEQEIDGQALLLLTLPTVQECMDLKLGPAIKLCHHIERVKVAFYRQYAN